MLLKKSLSVFLVFFIIFSLFFTTALAEGAEDDKLTAESSEEPVEPNEFITEQESLSSWLESRPVNNQPLYSAKQSIKELSKVIVSSGLIPVDYAYNIALNTIREVGAENGEVFWKNAKLTIPTEVSYPDGNTACYLFQIVYNNKIVGEIATSATIQECPVMFFTYNNNMSSTINNKGKVYMFLIMAL